MLDYHVHVVAHGEYEYTREWVERYLEAARAQGIEELGLVEHDEFAHRIDRGLLAGLRQRPGLSPQVRAGLECEYLPGREEEIRRLGRELDCDFLIGSVHFLDGWPFDHPDHVHGWDLRDVDEVYAAYYRMVAAAATSRLFDVIGHLDLVKIWGHRPRRRSELEHVRPLLGVLRQAGTAVEINTAGLRKPVGEIYPAQVLLEALFEASVPVTLASDAHRPDDVGADLGAAVVAARRAGYRRVMGFVGRRARERVL